MRIGNHFLLIIVLIISLLSSCRENGKINSTSSNEKDSLAMEEFIEEITNKNVQKTFYSTSLGDSKSDVIRNFAMHDLVLVPQMSTTNSSFFVNPKSRFINFGGMNWEAVQASFNSNDIFTGVSFSVNYSNKDLAMQELEIRYEILKQKYKIIHLPKDSVFSIKTYRICGKDSGALLYCDEHEGLDHNIWYGLFLTYALNNDGNVSDEL